MSNFIWQVLSGQPITIYGDGRQTRSFCYIDDMVRGLIALMASEKAGPAPVNLGNPVEFEVRQVAELVMELSGRRVPVNSLPLPHDDPIRRKPDIALARDLLGWEPGVRFEQGLERTIAYFRGRPPRRFTSA